MLYPWKVRLLKIRPVNVFLRYFDAWRGKEVGDYARLPEDIRKYAPDQSFADIGCMWGMSGENFVIRLMAQENSVIDFGFLITRDAQGKAVSIWDGNADQDYHPLMNFNGLVVVESNR